METFAVLLIIFLFYTLLTAFWIWHKLDTDPKEGVYEVVKRKDGKYYVRQEYWSGKYHYVEECDTMFPPYNRMSKVCFNTEEEAWNYVYEKIRLRKH